MGEQTCWKKFALIFALSILSEGPAAAQDSIIFPVMVFTDLGHLVHVEGTLAGEGVGYPENHTSLTCYQDRRECIVVNIESEGRIVFPTELPGLLTTSLWTAEKIIADEVVSCGPPLSSKMKDHWQKTSSTTWIIDRSRKTAEIIEQDCASPKSYHWKIEDPAYWKDAAQREGKTKP